MFLLSILKLWALAHCEPGDLGDGVQVLDKVRRRQQPGGHALCLPEAVVAVAGRDDFEAHRLLAVPVVVEVHLGVHRPLGVGGLADAEGDVLPAGEIPNLDLIAVVQVVCQRDHLVESAADFGCVLHGVFLLSIRELCVASRDRACARFRPGAAGPSSGG